MNNDFSYLLGKYLNTYLINELNVSTHTLRSYKKTFSLFVEYLVNHKGFKLNGIIFENITRDTVIEFLNYLENDLSNSINTRNQRLSAIKSFYQYCTIEAINNIDNSKQILSIKNKKFQIKEIDYLTLEEYLQVLKSIDTSTKIGRRNYLIITILYETACRADELRHIKITDLRLQSNFIILNGKGNKQRTVSITDNTRKLISEYIEFNNINTGYLFTTNVYAIRSSFVQDIVKSVMKNTSINKNVTPHIFRHTRAMHLLENGVSLIYIRDFLGHSSIKTTERYARVSNKVKNEAIEKANKIFEQPDLPDWTEDKNLLFQLLNL